MKEYLVKSHMGSFYISSDDPKKIEKICERCDDQDEIESSWNKGNSIEKIKALSSFLARECIKNKEEFDYRIKNYYYDTDDLIEKIHIELDSLIIDYLGGNMDLIDDFHNRGFLSDDEYQELWKLNSDDYYRQLDIIKEYVDEQIILYPEIDFRWIKEEISKFLDKNSKGDSNYTLKKTLNK